MNKITILHATKDVYLNVILDCTQVDDAINDLKEYIEKLIPEGYDRKYIQFNIDYYGHDGASNITLQFYREETDEEYSTRIEHENKIRKNAEDKERRLYEELKKKFGNN